MAPQDVAERLHYYMTTQMVLNTEKEITIEEGIVRVVNMNDTFPFLPCLKHSEGSPTSMSIMNTDCTKIKLRTILLNAVNLCTLAAFYASVHSSLPTDTTTLTLQSTRVCGQNKEHRRLINDFTSRLGLQEWL